MSLFHLGVLLEMIVSKREVHEKQLQKNNHEIFPSIWGREFFKNFKQKFPFFSLLVAKCNFVSTKKAFFALPFSFSQPFFVVVNSREPWISRAAQKNKKFIFQQKAKLCMHFVYFAFKSFSFFLLQSRNELD